MSAIPLADALAERMFTAEFGHTGLTWSALGDDAHDEWRGKAGRVLEGWWDSLRPFVVLDLANDTLEFASDVASDA